MIGLSQKRIILTVTPDDAGLAVFGLDFAVKGSALAATVCWMKSRMDQYSPTPQANEAKIEASPHSADSSLREQALGHLFLGQLLAFMWRNGARDIEVLKSEVDRGGYDVVLEANGIIRHVQLKSSFRGSKVREVDVSTKLLRNQVGASCGSNSIARVSRSSGFIGSVARRGPRCRISATGFPAIPRATATVKRTSARSIAS